LSIKGRAHENKLNEKAYWIIIWIKWAHPFETRSYTLSNHLPARFFARSTLRVHGNIAHKPLVLLVGLPVFGLDHFDLLDCPPFALLHALRCARSVHSDFAHFAAESFLFKSIEMMFANVAENYD